MILKEYVGSIEEHINKISDGVKKVKNKITSKGKNMLKQDENKSENSKKK